MCQCVLQCLLRHITEGGGGGGEEEVLYKPAHYALSLMAAIRVANATVAALSITPEVLNTSGVKHLVSTSQRQYSYGIHCSYPCRIVNTLSLRCTAGNLNVLRLPAVHLKDRASREITFVKGVPHGKEARIPALHHHDHCWIVLL